MDERLVDRHDHPPLGLAAPHQVGRQVGHLGPQRRVLDHAGRAVDVQPDQVAYEVDHQDADVRVVVDVAEAGQHAVAAVLGVGDGALVDDVDEPGPAGPEAGVTLAGGVGGGDERHVLPSDEFAHRRIQVVEHLDWLGVCLNRVTW